MAGSRVWTGLRAFRSDANPMAPRSEDHKAEGDKVIHGNLVFPGNGVHLAISPMKYSASSDRKNDDADFREMRRRLPRNHLPN